LRTRSSEAAARSARPSVTCEIASEPTSTVAAVAAPRTSARLRAFAQAAAASLARVQKPTN